jgi:hypothetical protein
MSRFIKMLPAWSAVSAAALLLFLALPLAAAPADKDGASPEKGATPEASEPKDADKSKDEAKPDEAPPPDAKAEEAPPAAGGGIQSAVKMKDILAEGFLVRTTVLVPAEAVTRQIGKVSSDAILLTLQKESAIAVCYYTLKAYVKEGLTDIASCTVFR